MPTRLEDYTVAIVCAIEIEYTIACELLDKRYDTHGIPPIDTSRDFNAYTFGRIHHHNVVIASLPHGCYGITQAAIVAERVRTSFPALQYRLMVGIAGGAPSSSNDIRLGDVIVSSPGSKFGGIVQYDFGKAIQNHDFEIYSHLAPPPEALLAALMQIKSRHRANGHHIEKTIVDILERNPRLVADYGRPSSFQDRLYHASYAHLDEEECNCQKLIDGQSDAKSQDLLVLRKERHQAEDDPVIHYGLIASANQLMKDAVVRDALVQRYGVLCFEMEAAGLMNNFPCLIIRGICDYADSHKSKIWQGYAAAAAAAFAKELLSVIPGKIIKDSTFSRADAMIRQYYLEGDRLHIERLNGARLPMESCYINLSLTTKSNESIISGQSSFSLPSRLRLRSSIGGNTIKLANVFETIELTSERMIQQSQRILIQGRAGVGKTTLCKKIIHDFIHKGLWNEMFDRILWLPLRRLKGISGRYSLANLINDEYFGSDDKDLAEEFYKKIKEDHTVGKTLFLLDGLDEISQQWSSGTHMYDFLLKLLRMPRVIVTSRPQGQLQGLAEFDLELETTGFEPDQVNTYLKQCVDSESTTTSIQQFLKTKPLIQGLFRIPIQLDALCVCWDAIDSHAAVESITMTLLYRLISCELWKKDIQRLDKQDHGRILSDQETKTLEEYELTNYIDMEEQCLEELAFHGLTNNIIEFTPEYQSVIFRVLNKQGIKVSRSYQVTLTKLSFLRASGNDYKSSSRAYHFLHLTFQEFFAAKYFVRHWINGQDLHTVDVVSHPSASIVIRPDTFLKREKYNLRYNIFWRFVTDLIQTKRRSSLQDLFHQLQTDPYDLIGFIHHRLLMHCVNEIDAQGDEEALRDRIFGLLKAWVLSEWRNNKQTLVTQNEFPMIIIREFLTDKYNPSESFKIALAALRYRPYIAPDVLDLLLPLANTFNNSWLHHDILEILHRHSTLLPGDILLALNQQAILLLKDDDHSGRAQDILQQATLPSESLAILVESLRDSRAPWRAVMILNAQPELPPEILANIARLLDDPDAFVFAAQVYGKQRKFTNKNLYALLEILKKGDDELYWAAALIALATQNLPQEILHFLAHKLNTWNGAVRERAIDILCEQNLPPDIAYFLSQVEICDINEIEYMVRIIEKQRLSDDILNKLVRHLEHPNMSSYRVAGRILMQQNLSTNILHDIAKLLASPDKQIRFSARMALYRKVLPQDILSDVIGLLKHVNEEILVSAAHVLEKRNLPLVAIKDLVQLLRHTEGRVHHLVADILFSQTLPREMISIVLESIKASWYDDLDLKELDILDKRPILYAALPKFGWRVWERVCKTWVRQSGEGLACYLYAGNFCIQDDTGFRKVNFTESQRVAFVEILEEFREADDYPAVQPEENTSYGLLDSLET